MESNVKRRLLVFLAALFLVSFVSPFSYLPNPLGVYYLVAGGYSYDPRMPLLANGFALLRGDVNAALRAKLDGLIGSTGLDPLDPNAPLKSYEIEEITYGPGGRWAHGTVRMTYSDDASRGYRIPVYQIATNRPGGWAYTGLDRYYAPHQELANLPLAGTDSPVQLGAPQRLALPEQVHQLGTEPLGGWVESTLRGGEGATWSPDRGSFLLNTLGYPDGSAQAKNQLWVVRLDGGGAARLAIDTRHGAWSPSGEKIFFLRRSDRGWHVVSVDAAGGGERVLAETSISDGLVVLGNDAWYLAEGGIWRVGLDGVGRMLVAALPELAGGNTIGIPFAVSPDGGRIAYRSGDALMLMDANGSNRVRVDIATLPAAPTPAPRTSPGVLGPAATFTPAVPRPAALPASAAPTVGAMPQQSSFGNVALEWSPDGKLLAAVASHYYRMMPSLLLVDHDGRLMRSVTIGPNGWTREPQWTSDGRWLFVNTFPEAGRRIVAVEVSSGKVFDLSQPRWDTLFSLAPSGKELLLWNGRGGFWTVPVEMR